MAAPTGKMSFVGSILKYSTFCGKCAISKRILPCNSVIRTITTRPSQSKWRKWRIPAVIGGLAMATGSLAITSSAAGFIKQHFLPLAIPEVSAAKPIPNDQQNGARYKYNFIADTVEKVASGVVYIEILGRHPFSGRNMAVSNGSGFIVREDGLILTNAHVVANKHKVVVKLPDGRSFEGVVQAVDPVSDLATVKINANDLPTLKLGRSSELRKGEFVIAMGNPFQLSNTVTAGIVSTVHRGSKELGLHKDMDYIQTDAVINFGNSGGPLVNLDGEAIGINTMKVTTGISFAIPSDYARQFLERAEKVEKRSSSTSWFGGSAKEVKRRYMGITMLTLTPNIINELKERLDMHFPDVEQGVMVHKVVIGSPAYNGGLQPGDIIVRIDGKDIVSSSDVYSAVEGQADLCITVRRGGESYKLTIIPEEVD